MLSDYLERLRRFSYNARLFLLSGLLMGLSSSIFALFLNIYLLSLGYKQDFIGLMAAIPPLVTAFLSVPAGAFGDRIGHRRAMIIGTVLATLGTLGVAAFWQPLALMLCMGLMGLAGALWQVVTAPFMIEESQEHERTHLFSVQFALMTFSGFFGSLLGGVLPLSFTKAFGYAPESPPVYQMTLLVATALVLASLFPLLGMRALRRDGSQARISWQMQTSRWHLFKLILPNMILGLGAGLFIPFMNVFFKLQFKTSDGLLGLLFAGSALVMGLASLAGPPLAQHLGKVRTIVWTQALSIPFLLLMAFVPVLWIAAIAFIVRYALMPMSAPIYSLFVMEQVAPEERATVNGWSTMAWNLFFALSSWASGHLQVAWGFLTIFVIVSLIYGVGIVLQRLFFTPLERTRHLSAPAPVQHIQC